MMRRRRQGICGDWETEETGVTWERLGAQGRRERFVRQGRRETGGTRDGLGRRKIWEIRKRICGR